MPTILLKLDAFLEANQISRYQLAKELDNYSIGRSTVYAIAAGSNNPSLRTVGPIIAALRTLTGKKVNVEDILEYSEG